MTKYLIISLSVLMSLAACEREGPNCHKAITLTNKSKDTVLYALILTHGQDGCLLRQKARLAPGEQYVQDLRVCWEDELEFRNFEMFIVDPDSLYTRDFYPCDSIPMKNKILKHFILTQDDLSTLKDNGFSITYP
jgi:hypothetical protein